MKHFIVLLKEEPDFIKCSTEEEALQIATNHKEIVNCIVSSDTPIYLQVPELRMGFAPEKTENDIRDIIGEDAYKNLIETSNFSMLEDKENKNESTNK